MKKKEEKEIWKKVIFDETISPKEKYRVSNLGRIKSYKVKKNGRLLKLNATKKYYSILAVKGIEGKKTGRLVHRLVAAAFLEKETELHNLVIHLNYKKGDNRAENLKWATKEEVHIHVLKRKKKSKARDQSIERLKQYNHLNLDAKFGEEKWKTLIFDENISPDEKYEISNYGRINSFKIDTINGKLKRIGHINNFQAINVKRNSGKQTGRYIHKLVAQNFIPNLDKEKTIVLHLDYNKDNNHVSNLKWATQKEATAHKMKNPNFSPSHSKLTEMTVRLIKKKLADPNRKTRVKILAKQFGVSEMQLWRIKTGENWGHVKI